MSEIEKVLDKAEKTLKKGYEAVLKMGHEVVWWDCGCEIECACGDHVILSDDGDPCLCHCGRVWSLETRLRCRKIEDVDVIEGENE